MDGRIIDMKKKKKTKVRDMICGLKVLTRTDSYWLSGTTMTHSLSELRLTPPLRSYDMQHY